MFCSAALAQRVDRAEAGFIAESTEAGCDIAVVTTAPGSMSQENVQRCGFDLLYTRAILVKDS